MKVAITGATGFIGSKLVRYYQKSGATVHILSRQNSMPRGGNIKIFQGDLMRVSTDELVGFVDGCDILYHCSAEIRNPAAMYATNVDGTQKLIKGAAGRIGRWVQLSSTGAYGSMRDGVVTEQTKLNPSGMYETTKVESDAMVVAAALNGAFEYSILRPSNVFGSEMRNQSLFGLIAMIQRGMFFYIGRPGATANYVHVDNVVAALLLCATLPVARGQIYNLSDQRPMEQFIITIATALGKKEPARRLPEGPVRLAAQFLGRIPKFPLTESRVDALTGRVSYSTAKIEQQLNYRHVITMEDGLREMVYFRRSCFRS